MIREIVRKEFHSNIITARFVSGFAICLVLISASTYVATQDYERRLSAYDLAFKEHRDEVLAARVYSELRPRVDRKPNPLSIFSQGVDRRLGNTFRIETASVPMIYDAEKHGGYNPFLALFPSIDLTSVFQIVLSLLALLFAYDAVSGEREDGTLKLMMSNAIPRSLVLTGKYLAALLSLLWPIAVSVIISLLMVTAFSGKLPLEGSQITRILIIMLLSVLYVSLFYLVGLFVSIRTRRTATSLMIVMFVWVFLTLMYPNAAAFAADYVIKAEPGKSEFSQIEQLWSEFRGEYRRYEKGTFPEYSHRGRVRLHYRVELRVPNVLYYSRPESLVIDARITPESAIDSMRQFYQYVEPLRIRTADRVWQTRKRLLDQTLDRKRRLTMNILRLSPATIYDNASAILASTDLGSMLDFMDQVRQYRRSLIQYLTDQKAFSSEQWFRYGDGQTENRPDLSGTPVFSQRPESVLSSIGRGTVDILLLIFLNVIFFLVCLTSFMRREVR